MSGDTVFPGWKAHVQDDGTLTEEGLALGLEDREKLMQAMAAELISGYATLAARDAETQTQQIVIQALTERLGTMPIQHKSSLEMARMAVKNLDKFNGDRDAIVVEAWLKQFRRACERNGFAVALGACEDSRDLLEMKLGPIALSWLRA
jgi:hypothetical protein